MAALVLFFVTMPNSRRRQERLAAKRRAIDGARFERLMEEAYVSVTTARFLWRDLEQFYYAPLRPLPGDRLESVIGVDRPEVEGLVNRFWTAMRGSDPLPRTFPLREDPTVAELGRHLDQMAGWSVRRAA